MLCFWVEKICCSRVDDAIFTASVFCLVRGFLWTDITLMSKFSIPPCASGWKSLRCLKKALDSFLASTSFSKYIRSLFQQKFNSYSRLAGRWKREWLFPPKKEGSFCFCDPGQSGAHHPFHQSLTYNDWDLYEWPFPFQIDPHILTLLFRLLWFFRFKLHMMVKARWLVDNLVNNELHGRAGREEFKSQWCDSLQWWSSFQWYRSLKWCSSLQW